MNRFVFSVEVGRSMALSASAAMFSIALPAGAQVLPQSAPAATTSPAAASASTIWLTTLAEGYKDAAKRQRPMLVIYGADWCVPCRELQKELERADVREKLAGWTLVHLDVDKPEPGTPAFEGPIPTLRILTSQAHPVASREGYLPGDELLRWLTENLPKAGVIDPDIAAIDAPDADATARLIAKLSGADPAASEAAIGRLTAWPDIAGPAVAEAFAAGNLRTRLASLELLSAWRAPIDGIDPWEPTTVTAPRIDAIRKWAAAAKRPEGPTTLPDKLQLGSAREDLALLLRTADPSEASLYSARLARLGAALLPEVYERLKQALSDRDRERLTALRYRLVAGEALPLQWPGGLERLASTDAQVRHAAADELVQRASAGDSRLLLEVFSDPDPIMREVSLRGLEKVGGEDATAALVRLLGDPVANVRAAVLKQLAESPSPATTDAVIAFVAREKDPDLVVHAVRVFRASKTENAINCLVGLLANESWRVRSEAVDALANIYRENKSGAPEEKAVAAVTKLLDDPDGFVAGRAMAAMKVVGKGQSLTVLVDAAKRHPELTLEVVKQLADSRDKDAAAIPALRDFCKHADPAVRAAALQGLVALAPKDSRDEITAALHDKIADLRLAGARELLYAMNQLRPEDGFIVKPSFFGLGGGRVKVDPNEWVEKFRAGPGRPAWMTEIIPDLQAMLKSDQVAERLAAALPLVPLAHEDEALPIILAAAGKDLSSRQSATEILPWLPWEKRLSFFKSIEAMADDDRTLGELAELMSSLADPRAAEPLWGLLAQHPSPGLAGPVYSALNQTYTGQRYFSVSQLLPSDVKAIAEASKAKLAGGNELQRVVALALLASASPTDAAEQAKSIYENPQVSESLHTDAFHVMLLAQPRADAQASAVAAVAGKNAATRKLSLTYLANGANALTVLRDGIYVSITDGFEDFAIGPNQPAKLDPPPGLSAEQLAPLLQNDDPDEAAMAGYLLCLLKDHRGLAPLVAEWKNKQGQRNDTSTTRLLFRAISALDDDAQTPVLTEIYGGLDKDSFEIREFYWTIRVMHGPNILKLRKTIRDEVGMQRLQ